MSSVVPFGPVVKELSLHLSPGDASQARLKEEDGQGPVLDWLRALHRRDRRAYAACIARMQRLTAMGHALRRPEADSRRDGIDELRVRRGRVQYRSLSCFHGQRLAVLAHALT